MAQDSPPTARSSGSATETDGSSAAGEPSAGTDADTDTCDLCDLPTPAEPIVASDVNGTFCCRGCLEVHRTLERADDAPDESAVQSRLDQRDRAGDDRDRNLDDLDGEDAFLAVDGMHCSTCEAFLETTAEREPGVLGATASYATDTIRLVYDPDRLAADDLSDLVSGYGYTASDRSAADGDAGADDGLAPLLLGGFFGMMVMVWYVLFLYPTYFGLEPVADFGGYETAFLSANIWLFTSFILFYTGYPILRGAFVSLRAGRPNMDLLVATAALGSYGYSAVAVLLGHSHLYFDVTVAIVLVVTAGTHYEKSVKRRATGLLAELTERQVDEARLESGETVPLEAIEPGDRLLVRPGERVPLDGEIREGSAAVDESLITGESLPVGKGAGDFVRGGTVVTDAPIVVAVGDEAESTLDRLVSLLWSIQSSRPGVQRLADKLATVFVPLVVVLAVGTAAVSLATGSSASTALLLGLTVVIVSCPCALGLATPLAVAAGIRDALERSIVIFDDTVFERLRGADTVVFDKTGTLTTGEMRVVAADLDDGLLRLAAALEERSAHPVGQAIAAVHASDGAPKDAGAVSDPDAASPAVADGGVAESAEPNDTLTVTDFESHARGVSGVVNGVEVVVGHPDLFDERGWAVPDEIREAVAAARDVGRVPVAVGRDGAAEGVVVVGDELREGWEETVTALADSGVEVVVLTGDDERAATVFREHDAIASVFAGVPPEGKAETVERLKASGQTVMVGDGTNDAPALAAADLGVALGGGTAMAADAADVAIVDDNLDSVATIFELSRAAGRRVKGNIGWAFCYNAVAIPLAVTGLLNPFFAAIAMGASSLLVVTNSSRPLLDD